MTDFYLFRKVVVLPELYYFVKWRFFTFIYKISPFRPKQNVPTNKMIDISKSLVTSHFIDRTRTRFAK